MHISSYIKALMRVLGMLLPISLFAIPANSDQKNVLFIAVDDLRPEMKCYGNEQMITPNIDQLASEGMLFANASTQQAICTPSRISMMLGLRPATTGLYLLDDKMRTNHSHLYSIPRTLKNSGYTTYSFGKIYHHKDDDPEAWSEEPWRDVGNHYTKSYATELKPPFEANDVPDNAYPDGKIADQAIAKLDQIKDEQFFLGVGFMKPHLPFTCPQKYWDLYERSQIPLPSTDQPNDITNYTVTDWGELRTNYFGMPSVEEGDLNEAQSRELKHGYWACVSFIDAQIGRVLTKLDELGLRENTIVVLWADHGWKLGEYGDWCKHTCLEVDVRIPLIVDVPGMDSGICNRPVESVDIYPTLMDLLEIETFPDHLDGISMKSLLQNPGAEWKEAVFAQYPRGAIMGTSVRTEDYRYTEYSDAAGDVQGAGELYDHRTYDASNPLGVEYHNHVNNASFAAALDQMQNLMNNGWDGVKYGARLTIEEQTESSVTLAIHRLPDAGTLKLFQRINNDDAQEIKAGQIEASTQNITIDNLEKGKAYYFKLQIEWNNGINYSPEVGVVLREEVGLLENGDFSKAFSNGWIDRQNNGSQMDYQITDGKLNASVSALGTNNWDLGFQNTKISSFTNKDIIVSFWAKANKDADLRMVLYFDERKYHTQRIDTTWQKYVLQYNDATASAFELRMWLNTVADYQIDDVEVYYELDNGVVLDPDKGSGLTVAENTSNSFNVKSKDRYDAYLFKTQTGYRVMASEPITRWTLYDMNGRAIRSDNQIYSSSTSVNFTNLENGVYILRLDGAWSRKLVW